MNGNSPSSAAGSAAAAASSGTVNVVGTSGLTVVARMPKMGDIRVRHREVLDTLSEIQGKVHKTLQDQERDLVRAFNKKMVALQDKLELEKRKNNSGAAQWQRKCQMLEEENARMDDERHELEDRVGKLSKDLRRVRKQLSTQEEDRQFLIKQLVAVKKENARLRQMLDKSAAPKAKRPGTTAGIRSRRRSSGSASPSLRPRSAADVSGRRISGKSLAELNAAAEQDMRYKSIIAKLKRSLEIEANKTRTWRTAYHNEVNNKNQLQELFEQCIEDVRSSFEAKANSSPSGRRSAAGTPTKRKSPFPRRGYEASSKTTGGISSSPMRPRGARKAPKDLNLSELDGRERVQVLKKLVYDERVLGRLYDMLFPSRKGHAKTLDEHLGATQFARTGGSWIDTDSTVSPKGKGGNADLSTPAGRLAAMSAALHDTVSVVRPDPLPGLTFPTGSASRNGSAQGGSGRWGTRNDSGHNYSFPDLSDAVDADDETASPGRRYFAS